MRVDDGAEEDEMEAEYDFSGAVRGKYADRFPPEDNTSQEG